MARYQILYWRHIPLGVRAFDINGVTRENLPASFQDTFQAAVANARSTNNANPGVYTTSGFRWGEEQNREGSATEVLKTIVEEIIRTWNEAEALATYEAQQSQGLTSFVDIKKP